MRKLIAPAALLLLVPGCGGGGSDSPPVVAGVAGTVDTQLKTNMVRFVPLVSNVESSLVFVLSAGAVLPAGVTVGPDKVHTDFIPVTTRFCDLCADRVKSGEQPACLKHCQATCMMSGTVATLAKAMEKQPRSSIFAPR